MITLNVNVDHFATVRNARGGAEPDPVAAAMIAEMAGASGIVCHLREDRRHIKDLDLDRIRKSVQTKLDLEMGANEEIIEIALRTIPELVTIVPEKRQELTTEGGLNVAESIPRFTKLCSKMHDKGIEVSFFVEPNEEQIDACVVAGADMVELHTGTYANLRRHDEIDAEFAHLKRSAEYARSAGLKVAAGHGLNYENTKRICSIHAINELSMGHSLVARAMFFGLETAVRDMVNLINTHYALSAKK
mgnify:FL=1